MLNDPQRLVGELPPQWREIIEAAIASGLESRIKPYVAEIVSRTSADQSAWHNTRMRSVDEHLQQAEDRAKRGETTLNNAAASLGRAEEKFNEFTRIVSAKIGSLETGQQGQQRQIDDLNMRITRTEDRITALEASTGVQRVEYLGFKMDIFGDPNNTAYPSLQGMITGMQKDIMKELHGIKSQLEVTNKTVQEHEQFISKRRLIEQRVLVRIQRVWNSKITTAFAIVALLLILGSLPGVEVVQRLVEAVRLLGK